MHLFLDIMYVLLSFILYISRVVISKKTDGDIPKKSEDDESKDIESKETALTSKDSKEDCAKNSPAAHSQWSPKDKRDNSCPGNVETGGSQKEETKMPSRSLTNSSKSVTGDETAETNENSKSDSSSVECQNKDPRVERRIRNKVCFFHTLFNSFFLLLDFGFLVAFYIKFLLINYYCISF